MINPAESHARRIFDTKPDIPLLYQNLLASNDYNHTVHHSKIYSLQYNKMENRNNILPIDSNLYILHNGRVALLRNNPCQDKNGSSISTVALQYIQTPGFVINPYTLTESELSMKNSDSIYPLTDSQIIAIDRNNAINLFNASEHFRKILLYSCLYATDSLEEQVQVRRPDQGMRTLLVNYLLTNQTDNQLTVTNKDLTTTLGVVNKTMSTLIMELQDKQIISKAEGKIVNLWDISTLEEMANDY